jgi:regulator of sigma E protease
MITTIILFIFILGILVFVHEAGHFFIAKKSGMHIDEFGFGFPPRLFGIQKVDGKWKIIWGHKTVSSGTDTVYSINIIPLGGFVKIVGENNEAVDDPKSFVNKPFFPRLLTLLGGVLMNVVLAWVLFSIGYMVGLPVAVENQEAIPKGARLENAQVAASAVLSESPAEKAGLKPGDSITKLDEQPIATVEQARQYILEHKGKEIVFSISRFNENLTFKVASLENLPEGQGPTGIGLATVGLLKLPWYNAIIDGAKTTVVQLGAIVTGLYNVLSTSAGLKELGGPVKIAQLTGQVADLGFSYLIQFTAFLSLNLAILNSLPFPALDGGRVLFLLIEKVRGKRNNQTAEQIANTAGFFLLLLLMLIVTVRDINGLGGIGHIFSKLIGS